MPPYEPPREQFTPPREVFVTPIASHVHKVSKSSKRRSVAKKVLKVATKSELPVVDLSLPLPPPSPTDDPLLLSAPTIPPKPRSSSCKSRLAGLKIDHIPAFRHNLPRTTPTITSVSSTPLLSDSDDTRDFPNFKVTDPDAGLPWFEPGDEMSTIGGWNDSSSDDGSEVCQTEEYREQFTILTVPTKMDSPPSRAGYKVNGLARPISPFRGTRKEVPRIPGVTNFEAEVEMDDVTTETEDSREISRHRPLKHLSMEHGGEEVYPQMLSDQASDLGTEDQDTSCVSPEGHGSTQDFDYEMVATPPRDQVLPSSLHSLEVHEADDRDYDMEYPTEHDTDLISPVSNNDIETLHSTADSSNALTRDDTKFQAVIKGERDEDEPFPKFIHDTTVGEEHLALEHASHSPSSASDEDSSSRRRRFRHTLMRGNPYKLDTNLFPLQHHEGESIDSETASLTGDSDSDDDRDSMDVGLVRITSHDPRAAARAAAILKQVWNF
jgi:hypothetical protein